MEILTDYTLRNVSLGAALRGVVSGVLGSFAVLRKQGLLGDALSHASLPGVCIAFMLTGAKSPLVLLVGAGLTGAVAATLMVHATRTTRLKADTMLGVVLSTFFGLGVLLLSLNQQSGNANQAGLNTYLFGQAATIVRRDVVTFALLGGLALLIVALLYKEFKIISFDVDFATSIGIPARRLTLLLTALLVVAVMIGLQTVGVVLMAAMMIAPGAAARLWTDRLAVMLALAAAFGALAGVAGSVLSVEMTGMPTGPSVILALTAIVLASVTMSPRYGVVAEVFRRRRKRHIFRTKLAAGARGGSHEL